MSTVVLIHGIWMNGWDMALLARRLRAAGYSTRRFSYPSIVKPIEYNTDLLHGFLADIKDSEINFVAHSLGGLLVRNLIGKYPDDVKGRVVTLGTPHQGSMVAKTMSRSRIGSLLLGKGIESLLVKPPEGKQNPEIGVIAGNKPFGSGMFFVRLKKPHDGTVQLAETKFEKMADYRVVATNHMGLLFSKSVSREVTTFLGTGRFLPETA
ncbi:MAG: alpha/beta fold hydrolase [Proteobacteria bacterium]|nr:alpha/beta fold hydrolase [Pseudomonadota bacterium]